MRHREYACTGFDSKRPGEEETERLDCSPPGGAYPFINWALPQFTTLTELELLLICTREQIEKVKAEINAENERIAAEENEDAIPY